MLLLPGYLLFYLLLVNIVMNMSFAIIMTIRGLASGYFNLFELDSYVVWLQTQWNILRTETLWRFIDPIAEGRSMGFIGSNILLFCVTPVLAPLLVFLAIVSGFSSDFINRATRGRAARSLGAIASRGQPLFLRMAAAIAICGAGAATILNVLR
jgi:hypothetical protein